ncbi:5-hydroxytryptamine receptor 3A-like [Clinocottus analis]|uniref:5-hydroxytryptamine receptor 3A-like n=1 Tax=Clinocottus analis TaxID=304258 RepID=UPI0035BEEDB6
MNANKRNVTSYFQTLFSTFSSLPGFAAALNCTSPTPESLFAALETNVFSKKLLRPVKNFSSPVYITIDITVVGLVGVDEKAQTLTSVLWLVLEWDIEGLSWEEKECGSKRVSIPRDKLWIPDIHIAEFMDEDKFPKTPFVYLYNTGHVLDDKPIRVVTSCRLNIYTFPFDIQNCSLTFGSYLHFASDIRLLQGSTAEQILTESRDVLVTNGDWELIGIDVSFSTLALDLGSYSEIEFYVVLRRRPSLYVVNLLIPSCFLITVDLFSFMLPLDSVDRSSFKMTLILGYTVFLLIMNDLLPASGETTPLINVFFSINLALMVASLLETVIIVRIQHIFGKYRPMPRWVSVFVLQYLSAVVCLPRQTISTRSTFFINPSTREQTPSSSSISASRLDHVSDEAPPGKPSSLLEDPALQELRKLSRDLEAIRRQTDEHFQGNRNTQEWRMVGAVIDRLLFGAYILFIVVSFIVIIWIWSWSHAA